MSDRRRTQALVNEWFSLLERRNRIPKWKFRARRSLWQRILSVEAQLDA